MLINVAFTAVLYVEALPRIHRERERERERESERERERERESEGVCVHGCVSACARVRVCVCVRAHSKNLSAIQTGSCQLIQKIERERPSRSGSTINPF